MIAIHPQYINDINGNRSMVVLPAFEFDNILEQLDDLEDVRLFDNALKNDTGERIPMQDAFEMIENMRKNG